jgi:hypothetical protein
LYFFKRTIAKRVNSKDEEKTMLAEVTREYSGRWRLFIELKPVVFKQSYSDFSEMYQNCLKFYYREMQLSLL